MKKKTLKELDVHPPPPPPIFHIVSHTPQPPILSFVQKCVQHGVRTEVFCSKDGAASERAFVV